MSEQRDPAPLRRAGPPERAKAADREARLERRRLRMLYSREEGGSSGSGSSEVLMMEAEQATESASGERLERKRLRVLRGTEDGGAEEVVDSREEGSGGPALLEAGSDASSGRDRAGRRLARREAAEDELDAATDRISKIVALARAGKSRGRNRREASLVPAPLPEHTEVAVPGDAPRLVVGPIPQVRKTRWVMWSAVAVIGIPTLVTLLYYLLFASDQYMAEGKFAIRTGESTPAVTDTSIMASLGMASSSPTIADSYIVVEYLQSRRLVEDLQNRIDLRKMYSRGEGDFYARLDPQVSVEDLTKYWTRMTTAYFDSMTGIVQFTVRAFTPADAQQIASATLESAERLINDLSRRARDDTVQSAKDDLSRAELRLKFARKAIRDFRDRQAQIDPAQVAASRMQIVTTLESELAKEESQRAAVASFLNPEAPSVRTMDNKIDALRKRIADERSKLGSTSAEPGSEVMSSVLAEYEELASDLAFAEQLYKSSLASLENARIAAERKMRYVTPFVDPRRPEDAEYPERIKNTAMVFLASALAWVIGLMIFYGIRDHTV